MGECRAGDCLIKLFGTTIPVPDAGDAAKDVEHSGVGGSSISSTESGGRETARQEDSSPQPEVVDAEEEPRSSPAEERKEKLKKPDKVLPCPRCSSMDTKFCYFNNYNVNQPRHFCKNCQRYWTAGGAMRNVPVGAGRRKNKSAAAAASHFLHRVRAALPADPLLKASTAGTVLSFGGAPAVAKEDLLVSVRPAPVPLGPSSEGSSSSNRNHGGDKEKPAAADGSAQQRPASINGVWPPPYGCAPSPAPYYSSGIAIPVYPAAPGYWGCVVPGPWGLPWPVQPPAESPTSAPSVSSGANSLTLGKHRRDGDDEDGRGKVWAPKTIRIDDADEVARSSIWSLIGIRGGDNKDADAAGHKLGTMFELKRDAMAKPKQAMMTSSPLVHANPVALARSVSLQEGS